MAAPKRTPFQRENDLQTIAGLYLRGMYQFEIAAKVKLSQQQVSYDLKTLQARWLASSIADIDAKKAAELAKYDELEREYWDAWERSKEASRKTKAVKSEDITTATVEETQQVGDPRYLQGVERCIERRCAVIGIDAPKKNELTGKDGGPIMLAPVDYTTAAAQLAQWQQLQRQGIEALNTSNAPATLPTSSTPAA